MNNTAHLLVVLAAALLSPSAFGAETQSSPQSTGLPVTLPAADYPADTWVDITPSVVSKADSGSFGCNDIQIDPNNPNILYSCWDEKAMTSGSRVTKSTDGGATWAKLGNINFESPLHIRIDPTNSNHLFLVDGVRQPQTWGLFESNDGGNTWAAPAGYAEIVNDARIKFGDGSFRNDLYDVQLNPSDASHLLVSFHGSWADTGGVSSVNEQCSGVIERLNGSWRVVMPDVGMKGVGFRCAFLNNSSTWLMGTQASGFWRTTNSGANWSKVYTAHMCHGGMQMTSRDGAFLVGSRDGVIRSTDNGATWAKVNGLTNEQSFAVVQGAGKFYTIPGFWAGGASKTSYSSTDGVTWTSMGGRQFSPGMYNGTFDTTNSILFAAVWQDGLWARKVSGGSTPPATVAPTINSQPTSATVTPGQTATFSVTAGGTPAPTYQWKKGGSVIIGSTSASYTTSATVSGDNGAVFTVVVTNSAGAVTSNGATLTLQTAAAAVAPTVSSQPANATVTAGQTVTFSVTAAGTAPLSYQWKKGDSNIASATSSSYTTPATTIGDSGSLFTVTVTNSAGAVTSSAATLTVNAAANPPAGGGGNTVGTYNPSAYGPYWYRRDQAKSGGWMELSTPILTMMRTKHPGDSSGDIRVNNLSLGTNGDLVLATSYGVMRSRDRGTSWTRLDGDTKDTRASRNTGYAETQGSICIDPEDSNRIAYLWFRGTSYYTNGSSWRQLPGAGGQDPGFDFGSIDWTSANPQLIAGPRHGTWLLEITRDASATWDVQDNRITGTGELGPGAGASMVCVVDANVMLYNNGTGNDKPSGVFRSTDQGRNWTKVYDGQGEVGKSPVALRDGRVYFTGSNGLLISRDKGQTWTKRAAPLGLQGPSFFGDWTGGKVGGMLIKSHERVCYSKDEGITWTDLIGGNSGNAWPVKYEQNKNGDGELYSANATNWVYNSDACDFQYGGGNWCFDPQNNIIYATASLGGPTIYKQLSGAGPGPAPGPQPAGASMPEKTAR